MVVEKHLKGTLDRVPRFFKHGYTLVLIVFSRALFYFTDFNQLGYFIGNLFYSKNELSSGILSDVTAHSFWFLLVILLCIPWDEIYGQTHVIRLKTERVYSYARPAVNALLLLLATMLLVNATFNPFLYTRF
jgi:hypothetical protein